MTRISRRQPSTPPEPITRTPLLTAAIAGAKNVDRVEVRRIEMAADAPSGLHLHPCPVVGVVVEGAILFEIEGGRPRILMPGEVFFEPAGARIAHFDAGAQGATFVAYYLLGPDEHELITMLD